MRLSKMNTTQEKVLCVFCKKGLKESEWMFECHISCYEQIKKFNKDEEIEIYLRTMQGRFYLMILAISDTFNFKLNESEQNFLSYCIDKGIFKREQNGVSFDFLKLKYEIDQEEIEEILAQDFETD